MRRVQSAATVGRPRLKVPETAKKRRRRNNSRLRLPLPAIRRWILSSRWISLAVLVLSAGALTLIGLDEHFYLRFIPVEGIVSLAAEEVVDVSGLAGVHVFAADPDLAAARIKELPGVIAANVTLRWPNQVSVHVQEDSPVAIWQEGIEQFWITESGQLIPARSATAGLLIVESEMPRPMAEESAEGQQTSLDFIPSDVLEGALMLRQLRPNIDKLYYRPSSGLSFQDGRGWRVHFGTGTDMHQKLVVYETLLEEILARGLTPSYVSVSNQEKPFYMAR
jgi:hypothetical protein